MASGFGADPGAALDVAAELATIRSDLLGLQSTFDSYRDAARSERIAEALDEFFSQSSDDCEAMDQLLQRATGMLRGLAEGTRSTDRGLAESLEPERPAPTPGARGDTAEVAR